MMMKWKTRRTRKETATRSDSPTGRPMTAANDSPFKLSLCYRTARMRRWGTCSWPGRCWKSLKSFTKGNRSPKDRLVTLTCILVFDLFLLRKEAKDDQLMAAQAHLKLGEVSVESGTTNR